MTFLSIMCSISCFLYCKKHVQKLKNSDKELASTMIMNFKDYDRFFEEHKTVQVEIKRDNKVIMNELKTIQNALKTLNNGFSIPSIMNTQ